MLWCWFGYLQVNPSFDHSVVVKQSHGLRINRDGEGCGELMVHHQLVGGWWVSGLVGRWVGGGCKLMVHHQLGRGGGRWGLGGGGWTW